MMHPQTGRALWALLHAYAMQYAENPCRHDQENAIFFMEVFNQAFADCAGNCPRCSRDWQELIARTPPDLSSRKAFYEWGIAAHDYVNQKRGVELMHPSISLHNPVFKIQ